MMALVRVLKPLLLSPCSRLNTGALRNTLVWPAKSVFVKFVETEIGSGMNFKPCKFTLCWQLLHIQIQVGETPCRTGATWMRNVFLYITSLKNSQMIVAVVRILAFCTIGLGSTPGSDYKEVTLVAEDMCGRVYMSLDAYKYSLSRSLKVKHTQPSNQSDDAWSLKGRLTEFMSMVQI